MQVDYIAYSSSSYPDICRTGSSEMIEGYRAMAEESLKFAAEALPLFNEIAEEY